LECHSSLGLKPRVSWHLSMNYKILTQSEDELFIEVTRATFRTRIVFDFVPDKDFYGIAVGCNYSFKGNPVGFLKDNHSS